MSKQFKVIEENAKDAPVKDIEWQGEEVGVESETKLEEDKGTGHEIILRSFDFAADPEVFKKHKPTAQELFESHRRGMESLLWTDELVPYQIIEPRLLFSKDMTKYRFVVACLPKSTLVDKARTLSELLTNKIT